MAGSRGLVTVYAPLLIIDFEATCWGPGQDEPPRRAGYRYAGEIIEFGCALLDIDSGL